MINNRKVSIVLPTYCRENYLRTAIDGVINQSFDNWELILVDDCGNMTYCDVKRFKVVAESEE